MVAKPVVVNISVVVSKNVEDVGNSVLFSSLSPEKVLDDSI